MSYKLEYPYTEQERISFIVEYNHNQGLRIEAVDNIVDVEKVITETEIDEETIEAKIELVKENHPTYYALEANEILVDGEVKIDPNYEEKQAQKEAERIGKLSLTKREVFLGLYHAKGITPEMIRNQIKDQSALIEFDYANDYYRGNPLINEVGIMLGITPEQLDKFFEDGNYEHLLEVQNETL
jgi:hypothetical protein